MSAVIPEAWGPELENDPEDNPCWACGPKNPLGLRMRFFDDGDRVRSALTLDDRYSGYSGSVLQGVLYSAMDDSIFWCAYARFGIMGTNVGDPMITYPGAIRTRAEFVVESWRDAEDPSLYHAACMQEGQTRAAMRWHMRPWSPDELAAALANSHIPRSIRAEARRALGQSAPP